MFCYTVDLDTLRVHCVHSIHIFILVPYPNNGFFMFRISVERASDTAAVDLLDPNMRYPSHQFNAIQMLPMHVVVCVCVFNAMRSIRPGAQYGSRNRHTFNAQMPVHLETPNIQSKAYSSFQPYISFSASEFKCTIKKRRAVHSAFSCSLSLALFIYNIGVMVLLRRKQNSILSFVPYEFAFCMDTSFNIQR